MEGNGVPFSKILEDDNRPIPALHQQRLGLSLDQRWEVITPMLYYGAYIEQEEVFRSYSQL